MKKILWLIILSILVGCKVSSYSDPTHPELRKKHDKEVQRKLRKY